MPVDTKHPDLNEAAPSIKMVRDVLAGERAIVKGVDVYLPRLWKQTDDKYRAMQKRAVWVGYTSRTLEAFEGFVFRKNPDFKFPTSINPFMADATLSGRSFYDYCKDVLHEVLSVKRCGTLIEWADPVKENRAFIIRYDTEQIINWKYAKVGERMELVLLVLKDCYAEWHEYDGTDAPDKFEHDNSEQWRVLELVTDNGNSEPYVHVTIWRRDLREKPEVTPPTPNPLPRAPLRPPPPPEPGFKLIDERFPNSHGTPLSRIPFTFHGEKGDDPNPIGPPLESIASINVKHYCTSADLESGRHACGVPTPYAIGFGETQFVLGPDEIWMTDNKDAKLGFLEYSGQSLAELRLSIQEKEGQMAALGARMLEKQTGKSSAEAFETVQIRQSGATSALTNITIANSQTLSAVLRWVVWWSGRNAGQPQDLGETVGVELNTDFVTRQLDAPTLTSLWEAYLKNAISFEVMYWNLQKADMAPSERKPEEEQKALALAAAEAAKREQEKAAQAVKIAQAQGGPGPANQGE